METTSHQRYETTRILLAVRSHYSCPLRHEPAMRLGEGIYEAGCRFDERLCRIAQTWPQRRPPVKLSYCPAFVGAAFGALAGALKLVKK
jgi:hypothetical protein